MIKTLQDIAEVRAGHPFRGSVPVAQDGSALTVQIRDISEHGVLWQQVVRTNPSGRKAPDWLRADDILFLARGAHNFAVHLASVPGPALCSQYFFMIRQFDKAVLPAFLAWQINQAPAQQYLHRNAEGSAQLSIRRGILEALPLLVPSLIKQRQILAYAASHQHGQALLEQLRHNRQTEYESIVTRLLNENNAECDLSFFDNL